MKTCVHLQSYFAHVFLEWEMFQTKKYRENQKTHFNIFFSENGAIYTVEKYITDGQATDDNTAHAHLRLQTHSQNM